MCEFKVLIDGEEVFRDVIYAKKEGDKVILRDILGDFREYEGYEISEVNVNSSSLTLNSTKSRQ